VAFYLSKFAEKLRVWQQGIIADLAVSKIEGFVAARVAKILSQPGSHGIFSFVLRTQS